MRDPQNVQLYERVEVYGRDGVGVPALALCTEVGRDGRVMLRPRFVGKSPEGAGTRELYPFSATAEPLSWNFGR